MTNSLKLTYLITGTRYGGAEIGMVRLLSELDPGEFDITVVAIAETEEGVASKIPDYVRFKRLGLSKKYSFHQLLPLVSLLRGTDILVCSGFHAAAVGTVLGRLLSGSRIFVWQHNTSYQSQIREKIFKRSYQLSDLVFADSKAVKQMIIDQFNISAEKIVTLPIAGVDTDRFSPPNETTNKHPKGYIEVITVGRLVEQKGYFDLIKCAQKLNDSFRFRIIGEGELRDKLEQKAPKNVEFLGHIDESYLLELLKSSHIYLQTSKHEGLCITVIEAMSSGLPVVASSVGGIEESVIPEETGYLCGPGEINCFCENLRKLGNDKVLRREMGVKGRNRVISQYSQSALAEKFRGVVQKDESP